MFVRQEDNEGQGRRRRRQQIADPGPPPGPAIQPEGQGLLPPAQAPEGAAGGAQAPVPTTPPPRLPNAQRMYPDLTQNNQGMNLRDRGTIHPPDKYSPWKHNPNIAEQFPLVQVPNPAADEHDANQPRFLYVFRPWTLEEAEKAVKGLTSPDEDVEVWAVDFMQLLNSYRLNGHETGQAFQSSLGKNWGRVQGNYTGRKAQGQIFPYLDAGPLPDGEYKAAVDGVLARARLALMHRANYVTLSGVKQKAGEPVDEFRNRFEKEFRVHSGIPHDLAPAGPYQQQLKNMLLNNFLPDISYWVRKHDIEHETHSPDQIIQYARHAEKFLNKQRKKGPTDDGGVFLTDADVHWESEQNEIYYQGGRRPPNLDHNRSRGEYRGMGRGGYQNRDQIPRKAFPINRGIFC
ncbi:uncharacterized protein LOC117806408 [Notolabrus celidotus]|uniref:uncharacterized protein LOC117806408 n=1 Tax=Notolabrus celidotus TaxID=1203425 RepID=UPI00148FB6EA|nr:uncharacterized protein LOC117806408 [Notolabrus celidotus]